MALDNEFLRFLGVTLLSLLNFILFLWQSLKRVPREVDKMKAEQYESLTEAAESNMQGAQISNELLTKRIEELKHEDHKKAMHIKNLEGQLRAHGIEPSAPPTTGELNAMRKGQ